ncbi:MAG: helix-turn-helix domain-containing protein [Clostridia bacterium]|jgi:putative transcriptional regulator|nr:helix-turn-helix domain-containing protein [Clostridia bacterium]
MNVADGIIRGLKDAIEYEKGNKTRAKKRVVYIANLPKYKGKEIRKIRMDKGLSQLTFAKAMGVSVKAVEAWEAGTNTPSGVAQRILGIIDNNENFFEEYGIITFKEN